jgi:hypothetical protein
MVEALNSQGMIYSSTQDIEKVIDNIHMHLMGIVWIHLHVVTVTTTLVGHD